MLNYFCFTLIAHLSLLQADFNSFFMSFYILAPLRVQANFGSVKDVYQNASLPFIPKPSYIAALTAQNTVGNALAYTGRIGATEIKPPAGGVANQTDVFIMSFIMPTGLPGFAAWVSELRE